MNNDLISRSALIAEFERIYEAHYKCTVYQFIHDIFKAMFRRLKNAPTVDAVEVVRCKDCIHWLNEEEIEDHVCLKIYDDAGVHTVAWQNRKPDDFCSYGKRKDGAYEEP